MSATHSTNEVGSEDLDLNSDAVPLREEAEIANVRVTESRVVVSISVTETLTEQPSDGQGQAEGFRSGDGINEVGVCGGGGDLGKTPLVQGSDVRFGGMETHGVLGSSNGDSVDVGLVDEGLQGEMESVVGGGDEKAGGGFDGSLVQKVSAYNDEEWKNGDGVKKLEISTMATELTGEQIQVVGEGEVAEMESAEVLNPKDGVRERSALDGSSSCSEKDKGLEVEALGGSTEEIGVVNADPSVGVDSLSNGDHNASFIVENTDIREENNSTQDENQATVARVAESIVGNVNQRDFVTVDSKLVAESQAAVPYDLPPSAEEAVSAQVTESVMILMDVNRDVDVQIAGAHAYPHEDQSMGSHVSELGTSPAEENQNMEVEVETQEAGGYCRQDEYQIEGAQPQFTGNESDMGSLVVDMDTCPGTDGNQKTVDEVFKVDERPKVKEMGADAIFSVSDCLDGNATNNVCEASSHGNQKIEADESVTGIAQADLKPGNASVNDERASYSLAPEKGVFSVSDIVWGKVKSHPWWPGQIFDPLDSSEQALKYRKKECFLVAYFGDRTFAWNEESLLKPFRTHFSQMEKQTNLESFRNAVNCALTEISRRVELGMACSCTPKEVYGKIKSQIIENAGIREESTRRDGVDESLSAISFEPEKLVEYIRSLARFPSGGCDRLDLLIAQAQLLAFSRLKGYSRLPEFQFCGGLLENEADSLPLGERKHSKEVAEHATLVSEEEEQVFSGKGKSKSRERSRKRRRILEDGVYPSKKERSLSDLMERKKATSYKGGNESNKAASELVSPSSGKKRKAIDSFYDDSVVQNRKGSLSSSEAAETDSPHSKNSFNFGECMRRAASQLTGPPPILKCSSEGRQRSAVKVDQSGEKSARFGADVPPHTPERSQRRKKDIPTEYCSPDEMLSQLCLAARDPMKGYSFLNVIISFFSDFRNYVCLDKPSSGKHTKSSDKVGGSEKKKSPNYNTNFAESFSFEDMQDSYWTDRIVEISPEEQPLHSSRKKKRVSWLESPIKMDIPTIESEDAFHLNPALNSKEQSFDDNHDLAVEDSSPAALILNFTEVDSVPSERNLNKIFSRFGPLKESETEVLNKTSSARVVFKRRADAEVAFSSAGKFSIFGPALVSYRLRYLSLTPAKALPCAAREGVKDMASIEDDTS